MNKIREAVHRPAPPPPQKPQRKVVQISTAPYEGSVALTVLCNDGTIWELNGGRWVQLPNIPQEHFDGCLL